MGSFTLGKAATLELLLDACIQAFDDDGELHENLLPRTFLLMHRWYVSSTELAGKLLIIYPLWSVDDLLIPAVIGVMYWIAEFPAEFDLDLGLIRLTEEFRDAAAELGGDEHIKLLDISTIPSYDWMRKLTQRKKQVKKGKASLLFDHLEPIELAEHLTFLEYKSIRRISFTDYQSYVVHSCLVDNPTLERSIALFNGISQWVQLMVLSKLTPQHRAEVITKYIHVAQKLLHLQNFNTLMAVVGGLSHSSISRLKETHSHLSPEVTKIWNEMTELVSSNGNYCSYRKAFSECKGFKIPILGVHLKDLIAVHVVFPDWVEEAKVNIVKMQQLYLTFNELVSLQSAVAQVEPNIDLIYLLTPTSPTTPNKPLAPLDWASGVTTKPDPSLVNKHIRKVVDSVFRNYDHDHDGYISQEDFESIAANFPFLDSFCVLDKDQIALNRSESLSMFCHYEGPERGLLTTQQLKAMAPGKGLSASGTHTLRSPTGILLERSAQAALLVGDCTDSPELRPSLKRSIQMDGLISKDEMMAYFLRANPLLQCKMGPGFIHNFQEMTYLKPTFCEHCAGFLWGIIKQGYKCKDCGVNCHKQCRELLVLACRRLPRSTSLGSVSPGALTHSSLPSSPSLPTCKDDDEVFTFPAVSSSSGSELEGKSITLMTGSAQRISVRLQRATTSQATQTDEHMWHDNGWPTDSGSHTFPKMRYRPHRKTSKSKGFARWENDTQSPTGTRNSRSSPGENLQNGITEKLSNKTSTAEGAQNSTEFSLHTLQRSADLIVQWAHAGHPGACQEPGLEACPLLWGCWDASCLHWIRNRGAREQPVKKSSRRWRLYWVSVGV
ncbi:hypothetical protein DNTS_028647 [Danionella cerebrum]|uniref:Ras guanyl-releasing protein 3 n=2 Tax=Danionella cerebrum TaxID=2873325 RepID=A0A553QM26_9TELE|nr:hypothetical protein DNTS_028647 [Danionella translucida]TRY90778.1 hypothetical protein DNTS_028647 [Danionella translucida]